MSGNELIEAFASPERMAEIAPIIAQRRRVAQHDSAILPRTLITLPIWLGSHYETPSWSRTWRWGPGPDDVSTVEVANPLSPQREGSGQLRYFDLDMVVALSHLSLKQQSRYVACDQADLLRWMGCNRELRPPRSQVHGSLRRLRMTQVASYRGNSSDDISADAISTFQILGHAHASNAGRIVRIEASLSDDWIDAVEKGRWQEVDLDCYAHLARTNRRSGLARLLYCVLTSHRSREMTEFSIPWASLNARYTTRHKDGRLRHVGFTRQNPVSKGLVQLAEMGVVNYNLDSLQDGIISGRFLYDQVPRLESQPRQQLIFDRDFVGTIKAANPHNDESDSNENPAQIPAPPTAEPSPEPLSTWHPQLDSCRDLIPSLGKKTMQDAISDGWDTRSIGWLSAWVIWSQEFGYDGANQAVASSRWVVRRRGSDPSDWTREQVIRLVRETGQYRHNVHREFDAWMSLRGLRQAPKAEEAI